MVWMRFAGYVALPMLTFGGYFACLAWFPRFTKNYLHTEHGAIEWGTALAFLIAAYVAARLTWNTKNTAPVGCRSLYGLFAVAGLLVALEEISYGQKLFYWSSPTWFAKHNSKRETNLHNMLGNKPSDLLRSVATIGCPFCCGIIPLWMRLRGRSPRTSPGFFYLVPQLELITISALTLVLCIFNKIPSIRGMASWSGHLGELKELYWGVAAACYASIISRRLAAQSPPTREPNAPAISKSTTREAA
jgi:hypothetical protein